MIYQLYKAEIRELSIFGDVIGQGMTLYVSAKEQDEAEEKAFQALKKIFPGRYFEMDVKAN